jgi:hypothetical protein
MVPAEEVLYLSAPIFQGDLEELVNVEGGVFWDAAICHFPELERVIKSTQKTVLI